MTISQSYFSIGTLVAGGLASLYYGISWFIEGLRSLDDASQIQKSRGYQELKNNYLHNGYEADRFYAAHNKIVHKTCYGAGQLTAGSMLFFAGAKALSSGELPGTLLLPALATEAAVEIVHKLLKPR